MHIKACFTFYYSGVCESSRIEGYLPAYQKHHRLRITSFLFCWLKLERRQTSEILSAFTAREEFGPPPELRHCSASGGNQCDWNSQGTNICFSLMFLLNPDFFFNCKMLLIKFCWIVSYLKKRLFADFIWSYKTFFLVENWRQKDVMSKFKQSNFIFKCSIFAVSILLFFFLLMFVLKHFVPLI